MKVRITYKSPDAIDYAVDDALRDFEGDKFEKQDAQDSLRDFLYEIGLGEYLTIEVDTDTKEIKVVNK